MNLSIIVLFENVGNKANYVLRLRNLERSKTTENTPKKLMHNNFVPTSRSNPCINCGDTKGDCRTIQNNPDLILCKKVSSQTDITNFGHRFGGISSGLWGKVFTDSRNLNEQQKEEWRREREVVVKAQLEAEAKRIRSLPVREARNQFWLKFIAEHPLSPEGRVECLNRGLTDETIKELGYYSLRGSVGCLMFSLAGYAQGSQCRGKKGYFWNNEIPIQLGETGQNPVTVLNTQIKPQSILVVEGTVYKPSIVAQRNPASIVIGISGLQAAKSSREIQAIVSQFSAIPVIFLPDGGSLVNPRVMQNIDSLALICRLVGVDIQFGWWGQHKKGGTDPDEIPVDTLIEYVSLEEFKAKIAPDELIGKASWMTSKRITVCASNSINTPAAKVESSLAAANIDFLYAVEKYFEYHGDLKIDQLDVSELEQSISKSIAIGKKLILDVSQTGMGKSTATALIREVAGIERVIHLSNRSRNLTTEEARAGYTLIPSRATKLYSLPGRQTIPGKNDIVVAEPAEGVEYQEIAGNCHLAKEFQAVQQSGWADEIKICGVCPYFSDCQKSSGDGYGYLSQVKEKMKETRLVGSLSLMYRLKNEDLSKTLIVLDDESPITSRTVSVSVAQIEKTIAKLAGSAEAKNFNELTPFLGEVIERIERRSMYGLPFQTLMEGYEFSDIPSLASKARAVLTPDVEKLRAEMTASSSKALLKRLEKHNFRSRQEFNAAALIPDFLTALLEIVGGSVKGSMRTVADKLEVTTEDTTWKTVQDKAKAVLVLDATASKRWVSGRFNVAEDDIAVISQPRQDCSNQNLLYVYEAVDLSRNRTSNPMKEVVKSLRKRHSTKEIGVLDYKGMPEVPHAINGTKYRDNRGTNAFKDTKVMVQAGLHVPNRGAMAIEYACMTGIQVDPSGITDRDQDFEDYVQYRTIAEEIQAQGRTRACQSPEEQHFRYVLENRSISFDADMEAAYPGIKISRVKAVEICPDAAKKGAKTLHAMLTIAASIPGVTLEELSTKTNKAISTLSHALEQFGGFKKTCEILHILSLENTAISAEAVKSFLEQRSLLVREAKRIVDDEDSGVFESATELYELFKPLSSHELLALKGTLIPEDLVLATDMIMLYSMQSEGFTTQPELIDMKLSETGDSINDLVEGLEYLVGAGDLGGFELLRASLSDDKESMRQAADIIKAKSPEGFQALKEMVVAANTAREKAATSA